MTISCANTLPPTSHSVKLKWWWKSASRSLVVTWNQTLRYCCPLKVRKRKKKSGQLRLQISKTLHRIFSTVFYPYHFSDSLLLDRRQRIKIYIDRENKTHTHRDKVRTWVWSFDLIRIVIIWVINVKCISRSKLPISLVIHHLAPSWETLAQTSPSVLRRGEPLVRSPIR